MNGPGAVSPAPVLVARAYFYAERFGLEAMQGEGCIGFAEPSCGDWNCVSPEHQILTAL